MRATRLTYVGELGWELLIPHDVAVHVYDTLREAGADLRVAARGLSRARLAAAGEGATAAGATTSGRRRSAREAGLGFAVAWDKAGGFVGRDALAPAAGDGAAAGRMVQVVVDDPDRLLVHDEPVFRDGELVGRVTSAAFGHTLGRSVALSYVTAPEPGLPRSWFESGHYEVELAGERYDARVSLRPMYDPKSERPKS